MFELGDAALPRVLAVVVTHNGTQWLGECLAALAAQRHLALDVIVVDNGSDDSAEPLVLRHLPGAEFVRLERNLGFGAAANHGLEVSRCAPGADHFLFLHDDVAVDPDCVGAMVACALETRAGVVGGKGVDWDDPEVLVEVGMAADQFGYPFSGLEKGEIDQGQHDVRREVLFVTSACILVSRAFVERCGSWDGEYFAFGEDLDLCTRARLSGFRVVVEPAARFRHAVALANLLRPAEPARAIRFYTRRNRSRTIAKNVATYRMPAVLGLYTVLATAEMVMLAALRRFEELPAYPRAFFSFLVSLPDVARRRRAVQKRRAVPDRRIRRYMVRDAHRARVFFERRLLDWGSGTLRYGARTFARLSPAALTRSLGRWIRQPTTICVAVIVVALGFGLRQVLFGGGIGAGGLWPFPPSTRRLLTDFFAGWRDVGLGTAAAPPAAFPLLWLVSVAAFGRAGAAQVLLVVGLLGFGLAGMARTMRRRTAFRPARVLAVAVYGLAPVVGLGAGRGDLGALALYAGLPFLLEIGQRMLGAVPLDGGEREPTPLRPNEMARDGARLALVTAAVVALGPSAYLALGLLWVVAGVHSLGAVWFWGERMRRALWVLGSLAAASALLLPWSLEALRPGAAILAPLLAGGGGGPWYGPLWSDQGFASILLLNPGGRPPAAAVALTVLAGALLLTSRWRRPECHRLVVVWFTFALVGGFVAKGWLPAPVATAATWMVVPLAALALLAGHLLAGLREELPQHALGWRHVLTAALVAVLVAGLGAWVPALDDWSRAPSSPAANTGDRLSGGIASFFTATALDQGEFRVLWLGGGVVDPVLAGARPSNGTPLLLTGPEGLTMLDGFVATPTAGERRVRSIVDALAARRLHLAGHLLGPASIRFLVVDPADRELMGAMARQRDIALRQQEPSIAIFENLNWLPRATLAPDPLRASAAAKEPDDRALMEVEWQRGAAVPRRSRAGFSGRLEGANPGPAATLLLADNANPGWRATMGGRRLVRTEAFGWSNRFEVPAGPRGEVRLGYRRWWVRLVWVGFQGALLLVALAMARVRTRELGGLLR